MSFELYKKNCLNKIDKSKKGNIDKPILKLIELINNNKNYFTTSSCSGRIMVYTKSNKKNESKWFFVSHDKINLKSIDLDKIKKSDKKLIWFKQESFILHIRAKDLISAEKLIKIARSIGLKRSGIQTINKNINLEIYYHLGFDMPIKINKNFIDENYLNECIKLANKNIEKNFIKIKELEEKINF